MNTAVIFPAILLAWRRGNFLFGRSKRSSVAHGAALHRAKARRGDADCGAQAFHCPGSAPVVVLDPGRIVEDGTPANLIARGGRFAALLELEVAGWDWRAAN